MFCANCGKEIAEDNKFCGSCGFDIVNKEIPKSQKRIKIIFHRIKRFTGCLMPMNIYIDKKLITSIENDQTVEISTGYGMHTITVDFPMGIACEKQITFLEEYTKAYIDISLKTRYNTE